MGLEKQNTIQKNEAISETKKNVSSELSEIVESIKPNILSSESERKIQSYVKNPDIAFQKINTLLAKVPNHEIRTWNVEIKNGKAIGSFGTQNLKERIRLELEESILNNNKKLLEKLRTDPNVKSIGHIPHFCDFITEFDHDRDGQLNDLELQSYLTHVETLLNEKLTIDSQKVNMEKLITSHCNKLLSSSFIRDYMTKDWQQINFKAGEILGVWSQENVPTEQELIKFGRIFQSVYCDTKLNGQLDYNDLIVLEKFLHDEPLPYANKPDTFTTDNKKQIFEISSRHSLHFKTDPKVLKNIKKEIKRTRPLTPEELKLAISDQQKEIKNIPKQKPSPKKSTVNLERFINSEESSEELEKFINSAKGTFFTWYTFTSPKHEKIMRNVFSKLENNLENLTPLEKFKHSNNPQNTSKWENINKKEALKKISTIKKKKLTNREVIDEIHSSPDTKTVFNAIIDSQELQSALLSALKDKQFKKEVFEGFINSKLSKDGTIYI